jgi:hypothetical protein
MTVAQIIDSVVLADSVLGTSFEAATIDAVEAIRNAGASRYSINNRTVVVSGPTSKIVTVAPPSTAQVTSDAAVRPGRYGPNKGLI